MGDFNTLLALISIPFKWRFRNAIVHGLQEVDKLKSQLQDVHVPLEVFEYIDEGRNPQLYTKDCMEKALTKNEQVKGKNDAFRKFRAHMLVELSQVFPTEMSKYRTSRGDERPGT